MFISILGTVTDEKDVSEGQEADKEVHRGVEVSIQPDEQDNEQTAQHGGQVQVQEQGKEHALVLWPNREPQEEELRHAALILSLHAPLLSAENERTVKEVYFDCSRYI